MLKTSRWARAPLFAWSWRRSASLLRAARSGDWRPRLSSLLRLWGGDRRSKPWRCALSGDRRFLERCALRSSRWSSWWSRSWWSRSWWSRAEAVWYCSTARPLRFGPVPLHSMWTSFSEASGCRSWTARAWRW